MHVNTCSYAWQVAVGPCHNILIFSFFSEITRICRKKLCLRKCINYKVESTICGKITKPQYCTNTREKACSQADVEIRHRHANHLLPRQMHNNQDHPMLRTKNFLRSHILSAWLEYANATHNSCSYLSHCRQQQKSGVNHLDSNTPAMLKNQRIYKQKKRVMKLNIKSSFVTFRNSCWNIFGRYW